MRTAEPFSGPTGVDVQVDSNLYTQSEVARAAYWFTDRFHVAIGIEGEQLSIRFIAKRPGVDTSDLASKFGSALIEEKVRTLVRVETAELRTAIFRAAFPA